MANSRSAAASRGRKKTQPAAAAAKKTDAKKPVALLPEKWMTARIIDATQNPNMRSGAASTTIELEVVSPRLYGGRSLYHRLSGHLTETIATYEKRFPGVNFLDAESIWEHLGGELVRVNVGIEAERTDEETGEVYPKRNRVKSIYPQDPARDSAEPADEEQAA